MTAARVTQTTVEVLTQGAPKALVTHVLTEVLTTGTAKTLATHLVVEVLTPVGGGVPAPTATQPVVIIIT
ncbi:MAG: hypothetical protein H7840_17845 [Alphaproteobacteria bacterium]